MTERYNMCINYGIDNKGTCMAPIGKVQDRLSETVIT